MLSYAATIAIGLLLAVIWAANGSDFSLTVLAVLGFLTRDVAIFVLMRGRAGGRGDFAALAILGALYLLCPMILSGSHMQGLTFLFLPAPPAILNLVAAWLQAGVAAVLALHSAGLAGARR